jgi:hypothetical protein
MFKKLLGSALLFAALLFAPVAFAQDTAISGNVRLACGTATGTSNASTLANKCGTITTESATTAAGGTFTETITDTVVAASDICFASVTSSGTGNPAVMKVTPAAGSLVVIIQNIHASAAFNATLLISFACFKA